MQVEIVKLPGEGLAVVRVECFGFWDEALWSRVKIRKGNECGSCEGKFAAGSEMYRPLGNKGYRYRRLCVACVVTATPKAGF